MPKTSQTARANPEFLGDVAQEDYTADASQAVDASDVLSLDHSNLASRVEPSSQEDSLTRDSNQTNDTIDDSNVESLKQKWADKIYAPAGYQLNAANVNFFGEMTRWTEVLEERNRQHSISDSKDQPDAVSAGEPTRTLLEASHPVSRARVHPDSPNESPTTDQDSKRLRTLPIQNTPMNVPATELSQGLWAQRQAQKRALIEGLVSNNVTRNVQFLNYIQRQEHRSTTPPSTQSFEAIGMPNTNSASTQSRGKIARRIHEYPAIPGEQHRNMPLANMQFLSGSPTSSRVRHPFHSSPSSAQSQQTQQNVNFLHGLPTQMWGIDDNLLPTSGN
ncbi:hypothetical protein K458DRAFT_482399 [Lentithecium fluviatile CBS 122367]|uniref:Uncharacterized protein n=1 Tax=Lentithecium fluviatile CBS 122367 TaxID=1168545 RepID=A0A6G1JM67_9PLEO|nr:hypothetical protein K458DRAFT_482399 [Lentithecium fluviatile CBS 122367]